MTTSSQMPAGMIAQLNKQIGLEAQAAANYLGMAAWAEVKGYPHTTEFLYQHVTEERSHMRKIIRYLNQQGIPAKLPGITAPLQTYKGLQHLFEVAFEGEKKITHAIHELVSHAWESKAYGVHHFLQWFIAEQEEEERLMQQILDLFSLIGTRDTGLYLIDQEIGKMRQKKA